MTEKAVEILNQGENGFFLMVEGGRIDHAGHRNLKNENIFEVIEFDLAVKIAMDFAEENKDTLVIVTADHETGALTKEGSGYKFKSDNHSDAPVPVFAMGPGAENFTGDMVNTDIPNRIKSIFIEAENAASESTTITTTFATEMTTATAADATSSATSTGTEQTDKSSKGCKSASGGVVIIACCGTALAVSLRKRRRN